MTTDDIKNLIKKDGWMIEILAIVRSLNLPDSWVGAGFVRSKVWDYLHGYTNRTPLPDLDVIYFDKSNIGAEIDRNYEKELSKQKNDVRWSVKNQARMHLFHNDKPYRNSEDALARWVETATCIGARLDSLNNVQIIAPHGTRDLVNLILRPTFYYKENTEIFFSRIDKKKWLEIWPKLKIADI